MSGKSLLRAAAFFAVSSGVMYGAANIVIVNTNAPGVGFNDPAPATPVGGNAGTTVGQQRLIAFQYAASIWGQRLDSAVEIRIQSSFVPLSCTATGAVLGSAGTLQIFASFPRAEFVNTWYGQAIANKLAGQDLAPGDPNTVADDLRARFNSNLGQPNCLSASGWYYGLDTNTPSNRINLVAVLLHEFAHGLGFQGFTSVSTGEQILNLTDVYSRQLLDTATGKAWNAMTNFERQQSTINPRRVVWTGINVTKAVPQVLAPGTPLLRVTAPAAIAGNYPVGAASFGPPLSSPGLTAPAALALDAADAAGPSTTDGCSAIVNTAAVIGRIAVIDRGTCGFTVKVKNAQNAGAVGVIIADNAPGGPPAGLGGTDPTIVIPSVRVTQTDGALIKAQLAAGVTATLAVDLAVRAGADPLGRALVYTPNPVQPGSSVSHWDTIAAPNQLMEPSINADLTHSIDKPQDLSLSQMRDIGWFSDFDGVPDSQDVCPGSDLGPTIVIQSCNTGVANTTFVNGCRISDLLKTCAVDAKNEGQYKSCVSAVTNELRRNGVIENNQHGAIQSCAAKAKLP